MSAAYFWTIVGWTLTAVAFSGAGGWIVWGAFDSIVEDEGAAR